MEMPDKTREMVLRGGALFIRREIALTLSKAWRFWCLFLRACRHGNIWPNLTEMCVHAGLFAAKMFGHTRRSLFFICSPSKNCCGTPSTTAQSSHQASTGKQTDSFAIQLTNICAQTHTHTCIHTHLITAVGGGFEAVTNCPASWGYPWRAFLFHRLMLF